MENNRCYLCGDPVDVNEETCKNCGARNLASAETARAESSPTAQPSPEMQEIKETKETKEEPKKEEVKKAPAQANPATPPPPQYGPYGYPYPPYPPQYMYYAPEPEPQKGSPYRPISPWAWVGINFLACIPIVNIIVLIVWACGGSKNVTLKNYSRGFWLTVLVSIALWVALFIFAIFLGVYIGISEISLDEYFNAINNLNI